MSSSHNIYSLALPFLNGVKDFGLKRLISKFQTAENIFSAKKRDLVNTHGIGEFTATKLINSMSSAISRAEEELVYLEANELGVTTYFDDDYPIRLKECDDAPIVLYYKGKTDFNPKKAVSVVGTRQASKYGLEFCKSIISELAERYPDIVIISGLAYGIDIEAHQAALKNNLQTWAVLGHSLESVYPVKHKKIAAEMIDNQGALITDFPHKSKIDPANFIKRNRIVAGLCDALIIVESGVKGGAMVTANIANHYNKDVFALPGNINAEYSKGCNTLIKSHRANLLQSVDDIEYIMNWQSLNVKPNEKETKLVEIISKLNPQEKQIVEILKKYDFLDIDNLTRQSKINPNTLSLLLLEMEFKGVVRALPGKLFALKL